MHLYLQCTGTVTGWSTVLTGVTAIGNLASTGAGGGIAVASVINIANNVSYDVSGSVLLANEAGGGGGLFLELVIVTANAVSTVLSNITAAFNAAVHGTCWCGCRSGCAGVLVCWCAGLMFCWYAVVLACCFAGVLVCWTGFGVFAMRRQADLDHSMDS